MHVSNQRITDCPQHCLIPRRSFYQISISIEFPDSLWQSQTVWPTYAFGSVQQVAEVKHEVPLSPFLHRTNIITMWTLKSCCRLLFIILLFQHNKKFIFWIYVSLLLSSPFYCQLAWEYICKHDFSRIKVLIFILFLNIPLQTKWIKSNPCTMLDWLLKRCQWTWTDVGFEVYCRKCEMITSNMLICESIVWPVDHMARDHFL